MDSNPSEPQRVEERRETSSGGGEGLAYSSGLGCALGAGMTKGAQSVFDRHIDCALMSPVLYCPHA
jgi:hypothetical protein